MNTITMIPSEKLHPHPDNPRKNLGDISELTESIKANGILQNLTVVPKDGSEDEYLIVIGHRRHAAGTEAGLAEFPCVISYMDKQSQVKIMLCENCQRNDLTIAEQASGFQMMIDFGMSVKDLSKETGFAESTIYHRLNIAKLDPNLIADTQLSINDFIELEKIEDVEERNALLEKYTDRYQFQIEVARRIRIQTNKRKRQELIDRLEAAGITERAANTWDSDVNKTKYIHLYTDTDINDIDIEEYDHYTLSKYSDEDITLYSLKDESEMEPEESAEDARKEEIVTEVGELLNKLDTIIKESIEDIYEYKKAILKKEKKGDAYIQEFLSDALQLVCIEGLDCNLPAFNPDTYEIDDSWAYDNISDYYHDMKEATGKVIEHTPASYVYEMLIGIISTYSRMISGTNWPRGLLNHEYESIVSDDGVRLYTIVQILSKTGFILNKEAALILAGEHEDIKRIEELRREYISLK